MKLNTTRVGAAQLLYSTYITGTNGQLWPYGVAVNSAGIAYLVGETSTSIGFPIKNAMQPTYVGGNRDGWLMKVDTTQTGTNSLLFSTYLGGDQSDVAHDVAIDHLGRAVVAGTTFSTGTGVVVKFPLVQQVASCPTFVRISPFVTIFKADGSGYDLSSCYASSYVFYGVATGCQRRDLARRQHQRRLDQPTGARRRADRQRRAGHVRPRLPGTGGNSDALIVRISPSTDLVMAKTASPNPVLPGGTADLHADRDQRRQRGRLERGGDRHVAREH